MKFQLHRISRVEDIDVNKFLQTCAKSGGRGAIIGIDLPSNIVKAIRNKKVIMKYTDETFERKFQFKLLLHSFQTIMQHYKKNYNNSCDTKNNKNKSILPNLSSLDNSKNDYKSHHRSFFGLKTLPKPLLCKSNSTLNEFSNKKKYNCYKTINSINSKNEKLNSKKFSKSSSKLIIGNRIEFNESLHEKTSNDPNIEISKSKCHKSQKSYIIKNKRKEKKFNLKLYQLNQKKYKQCKEEDDSDEFENKFNPRRFYNLLKKQFDFFQINEEDQRFNLLNENIKKYENEDSKTKLKEILNSNDFVKPSKKIIQNMIRKDKVKKFVEKSDEFSKV